jgi:Pentapeptide repeats (8 copies)
LDGAALQGATLQGSHLQGASFWAGGDMRGTLITDAEMQGTYLLGADLRGASLAYAQMQGADLRDARLQGLFLHLLGRGVGQGLIMCGEFDELPRYVLVAHKLGGPPEFGSLVA